MKDNEEVIDAVLAATLLTYDPVTGDLRWLHRTPEMFAAGSSKSPEHLANQWNATQAGKLAGYKTKASPYRKVRILRKNFSAHRLIWLLMTGVWPSREIDHINGVPGDDRWLNLREATHTQNMRNSKGRRHNQSGLKGAHFHKQAGKWRGRIVVNKAEINLGLFATPEEAHQAYCEAAEKYFGEFARTK